MEEEQGKIREKIIRFNAVDGRSLPKLMGVNQQPNNTTACLRSHLAAIREAKCRGWDSVLILEDDVILHPDFNLLLDANMINAPNGWKMLFLNGTNGRAGFSKANNYWYRILELYGAFAYIVHSGFYNVLISILDGYGGRLGVDDLYAKQMKTHEIYKSIQPIAFHRGGYSYREEREINRYKHLEYDGSV